MITKFNRSIILYENHQRKTIANKAVVRSQASDERSVARKRKLMVM
nr:MAG TPA: hypothetical protein [Siphoviridae sp. ctHdl3]